MSDFVRWVESKEEFDKLLSTADYVVVDFTAPSWCRPCQQFAPHFDKAAENAAVQSNWLGRGIFVAVDVDKAPWAMQDYGVRGVPTVKIVFGNDSSSLSPVDLKSRTAPLLLNEISNFFQRS